ncbi:serine/threonine protein kinase, partial [Rhizobacter sp. P5_C2]
MSTPTGSAGLQDDQGALRPGTRLGEFEILRVLGVGGFGIVYLAMDHALERQVAIKEYMPAAMAARGDGEQVSLRSQAHLETFGIGLRSFVNEAKLLARFDHPSLVKVYRFWEANGTAYMVMPYYAGRTLKEERKALAGVPSDAWIRGVIDPLLGALQVLHDEDVFHRDIAPDNILLLPSGLPVLLDFGAARRVIGDRTQTLTAILKPNYAPIEQYADVGQLRQGPWTDLYALGAVLHFVITGRPPVPSAARAVHDDAKPLAQLDEVQRGTIGQPLLRTIDWALAVRPSHRPQNVAQFRDALDGKLVPPERPLADGEATQPVSREQVQAAWSPTQPIDGQATVFQPTVAATQPVAAAPAQGAGAQRAAGAAAAPVVQA